MFFSCGSNDEIGIRLKQGTKVYAYLRVGFKRLKLFKDGLIISYWL